MADADHDSAPASCAATTRSSKPDASSQSRAAPSASPVAGCARGFDQQAQVGRVFLAREVPARECQRSRRVVVRVKREQCFLALMPHRSAAAALLERGVDLPAPVRRARVPRGLCGLQPDDQPGERRIRRIRQRERTARLALRQERFGEPRARLFVRAVERVGTLEAGDPAANVAGAQRQVGLGHQPPARDGDRVLPARIERGQEPAGAIE